MATAQKRAIFVTGIWLLLIGGAHGISHLRLIYNPDLWSADRRELFELMQSITTFGPLEQSVFTAYTAFSVGLTLFLVFAGLNALFVARFADDQFGRRFSLFSLIFWAVSSITWFAISPMIGPFLPAIGTVPLYAFALYKWG